MHFVADTFAFKERAFSLVCVKRARLALTRRRRGGGILSLPQKEFRGTFIEIPFYVFLKPNLIPAWVSAVFQ